MGELCLSKDELFELTARVKYRAQSRALDKMGVSYIPRADGFPLVNRQHFDQLSGADNVTTKKAVTLNL